MLATDSLYLLFNSVTHLVKIAGKKKLGTFLGLTKDQTVKARENPHLGYIYLNKDIIA